MNDRCRGIKRSGEPCTMPANGPDGYCWAHSPDHAEQRRRAASKAGRSKPTAEVHTIKEEIKSAIVAIQNDELDRNKARAMFTGWGVLLDYIKLERGIYIEEDLAARIEELKRERPHAS